ncbi:unnamed protein product [Nezara viridula]|uniref:protein-serine/threonine phosphatase n=1 Tax=Nezara viridula TaxID=85310 RepID=A0A9P0MTG1_NEZVI|nr:unnamed protein product [Nezara viridula]
MGGNFQSGSSSVDCFLNFWDRTTSALQTLHKVSSKAREHNYFLSGLTHEWVAHYEGCISSDQSCLNEWHAMDSLESRRPPSPDSVRHKPTEREETERVIRTALKEIMMTVDLDEVTSKQVRSKLEESLDVDLGEFKVCHILNVTREIDNFFPGMFDYLNIRVYDDEKTDLLKHWDNTFKYISKAKKDGSKVLVHCKMGVSRSASVVIAYAMKAYSWDLKKALNYVQNKRQCIKPNSSFISQLETYQGILDAMKNREKLQRSKSETNLKSKHPTRGEKRSSEKEDNVKDSDVDMKEVPPPAPPPPPPLPPFPPIPEARNYNINVRMPCNGLTYSVSQNKILHLPCLQSQENGVSSVKTRISALESQKAMDRRRKGDRRGLVLNLTSQFEEERTERRGRDLFSSQLDRVFDREETVSRQNSWSSFDSGMAAGEGVSRQSSWGSGDTRGIAPSRNSSWGSYDIRTQPPETGLVKNLKKEFEAKSGGGSGGSESLPSSPTSDQCERPSPSGSLEELSVRQLVGRYEAPPPRPQPPAQPALPAPVVRTAIVPRVVVTSVLAKAAHKKQQQGKTHPLARLTRHSNPVYNTM